MAWAVVVGAGIGLVGGALSASSQAGAAKDAARAQTDAQGRNLALNSGIYNANAGLNAPARALGGFADAALGYGLGLTPNLNVSSSQVTPQVSPDGSVSYVDLNGNPVTSNGSMLNSSPDNPSPGSQYGTGAPLVSTPNGYQPSTGGNTLVPNPSGGMTSVPVVSSGSGSQGTPTMTANQGMTTNGVPTTGSTSTGTAPSTTGGYGGLLNPLNPATFTMDPGYKFNLDQGNAALQRQQAASGHQLSGAALKDAMTFASGLADTTYNSAFNRSLAAEGQQYNMLAGIAGAGQIASNQVQSSGNTALTNGTNANTNIGNAQANGAVGAGNAWSNYANTATGIAQDFTKKEFGPKPQPVVTSTPT